MAPEPTAGPVPAFHVLGPLRVVVDGAEVPIATRRQRALVSLLVLNAGRVVPADRLVDQLWDGAPPAGAAATLRSYVSNVRRALRDAGCGGPLLVTRGQGYLLDVPPDAVDAVRLERLAQQGRERLRRGRPDAALAAFDAAVASWGGDPLVEVADHEVARGAVARLTETYLGAVEGRCEALLALGRHADAIPALEAFATDHPFREEPRALLMQALHRAGRTSEALAVHRAFRSLLQEELGIDPSARLDDLHRRILARDPGLGAAPVPTPPVTRTPAVPPAEVAAVAGVVGRAPEVTALTAALDSLVADGQGGVVLLSGEPGVGKSALLDVAVDLARHRGAVALRGRAPSADGAPAFWPWTQVVDALAAGLDDDALTSAVAGAARPVAQLSPTVAERTGGAPPVRGNQPQTMRFLLYEAVSAFLRQAAGDAPVLVVLDDLHWADLPSLELVSHLAPTLGARRLLLVGAYRDTPAERTDALAGMLGAVSREDVAQELPLTGLGYDDVAHLVGGLLGADEAAAPPGLVALLHDRTGGNPFFVRQLARLVQESGADALGATLPAGVRHVVAQRLAALPEPVRLLLEGAAVVGREFDVHTAAAAAGQPVEVALDGLDEAVRHGLVEQGGRAGADRRFVHTLVQEVVLGTIPAGRAARLHARAADRLAAQATCSPYELARHRWEARAIVGTAAVPALVAAAEAAAAVFAHEEAETHLRRALALVGASPDTGPSTELALQLGLLRLIVTSRGWGVEELRPVVDRSMALAHAGAFDDETARLWWFLFFFLLDRDDPAYVGVAGTLLTTVEAADEAARQEGREPTAPGPTGRTGHAARAALNLFAIFHALDRDDRHAAHAHLLRAREHVDAAPADELAAFDEHLHVMQLLVEGYWAALTGDAGVHRSSVEAAIALADADGRPFPRAVARTLAAATGPYVADPAYVCELATQALDLDERFGFSWLAALARCVQGWAEAHLDGRVADVRRRVESQLHEIVDAGHLGNQSLLLLLLADLLALEGHPDRARDALARARERPGPYRGLMRDLLDDRSGRLR